METSLRPNIDWVGFVDWNVRDFHSYDTFRGATYNAYLVRDEKTALIDTVKAPYASNLLANIRELTDLSSVDYVVCNHAEPDHAGALGEVLKRLPNATLLCNQKCFDTLSMYFDTSDWKYEIVAEGDTRSLGSRTLAFVNTPMVHWPESMMTYVPEEKLLFSMDGFGQHYASSHRFDDENPLDVVMAEAKTYYANIVTPYGKQVHCTLDKASGLDIEMIAPSHGVIWRSHIPEIISAYRDWSNGKLAPKVLVIYDSMWESTGAMGEAIVRGATIDGVDVRLMHVRRTTLTEIAAEALDCPAIAFGSATLNRNMMPMASAALTYLKGLNPPKKATFAFGSYGWGIGGPEEVAKVLEAMKWDMIRPVLKTKYRPTPEILAECEQAGLELARKALAMAEAI